MFSNKRIKLLLALICFVFAVSFSNIFMERLDLNGDNAEYFVLAQNIVAGNGYTIPYAPEMPPASQYPPATSYVLAFFMLFLGPNIIALKIVIGLFFLSSVLLLFLLVKNLSDNIGLAFAVSILLLLNYDLLRFSTMIMSEMPYLFFSVLTFYAIYKDDSSEKHFLKSKWFWVSIVSMAITYYFRTIGITLVAAVVLHQLFKKQWFKLLVTGAGFVLLNLPWSIRNSMYEIKSRYLGTVMAVNPWRPEAGEIQTIGEFVSKMIENFNDTVIRGFSDVLFPFVDFVYDGNPSTLAFIGGILVLAVVLYGAFQLKAFRWILPAYILANIGIFMLWHGGNAARYVIPLTPFIAVGFFFGIYHLLLWKLKVGAWQKLVPFAVLFLGLFMFPSLKQLKQENKSNYPPPYKNYFQIAKQLERQSPKDVVVICRKPAMFYIFAQRFSLNYSYTLDDKEMLQYFLDKNVTYVVLEQLGYGSTYRYLLPVIQKHGNMFATVYQYPNPDTYLLQFNREAAQAYLNSFSLKTETPN